jgi:cyclopropane fatty-acyl-phospholipid synthase-like methyltransferase
VQVLVCVMGEITCQMAETYPGIQIFGIDFSDEQIKIASDTVANNSLLNTKNTVMLHV